MTSPWVPNHVDVDKWTKHFKLMAQGKLRPNRNGMWIVGDHQGGQSQPTIKLNYVTPTAAAVQRAESEMKRQQEAQKPIRGPPVKRVGKKSIRGGKNTKKAVKRVGKPNAKKPIRGTKAESENDTLKTLQQRLQQRKGK